MKKKLNFLRLIKKNKRKTLILLLIISSIVIVTAVVISFKIRPDTSQKIRHQAEIMKQKCENRPDWKSCYANQLEVFNRQNYFDVSLQVERELERIDQKTTDCHWSAHKLASSEIAKNPEAWLNLFDTVDHAICNNGYIHGALETLSGQNESFQINEKTIPNICSQIERKINGTKDKKAPIDGPETSCVHVMGHLLLVDKGGDINETAKTCNMLSPEIMTRNCLDGLFMENLERENLKIHGIAEKQPLNQALVSEWKSLCSRFDGATALSCWREIGNIYVEMDIYDTQKLFELCFENTNDKFTNDQCYFRGVNTIVLSPKFTKDEMQKVCQNYMVNKEQASLCIGKVISPMLGSSFNFTDKAIQFCNTINEEHKSSCFSKIGQFLKYAYSESERTVKCNGVPAIYLNNCLGKTNEKVQN